MKILKSLSLTLILSFLLVLPARGEVYKWVDENGTVSFTDAFDKIPERYRKGAEKKNLPTTGITLTVRHVIDGDTIIATTGEKVRYLGIDAPELASEKGPVQFFAEDSKNANKELVNGKSIRMEFDAEKIDRHGRLLAYVYLKDGTFINAKLIDGGSARVYFIPPNMKYYDQFKKLEKEAIGRQEGLWSEPYSTTPIPHFEAIKHIGKYRFIEGTVKKVYKTEKAIYLNFGENPDEDFTVTIFNRDYPRFYEKGIDLINYYTGKKIIVYGKVKLYRGAEIIVSFPEDIIVP
ncbi:MAG: thermonuclease family protein [Nitrospinota bacterium]